jgi:hypothetical protein
MQQATAVKKVIRNLSDLNDFSVLNNIPDLSAAAFPFGTHDTIWNDIARRVLTERLVKLKAQNGTIEDLLDDLEHSITRGNSGAVDRHCEWIIYRRLYEMYEDGKKSCEKCSTRGSK